MARRGHLHLVIYVYNLFMHIFIYSSQSYASGHHATSSTSAEKNRATLGSILSVSQSIVLELIEREYVKMREFDFLNMQYTKKKIIKYRSVKNYQV